MCGITTKWKQLFYDEVEPIKLKDPLAVFLGAIDEHEEFIFTYEDAVKLAGHSCPAVSGAYKVTEKALKALYGNEIPMRGGISVKILGSIDNGANGPISQVISLITGAAPETGFAGLGNSFVRKNKLIFDEQNEEANAFVFTRDDNGKSVKVTYHPENVPADEDMHELFTKSIVGTANEKQKEKFKELWQKRVKCVLFEEAKSLFSVEKLN
ncbi:MAG: FmdE family protein [Candidatus Omnitrophota bacterium]|nr:FmdE family protein [Candidatus Omnitrophota bacterium]